MDYMRVFAFIILIVFVVLWTIFDIIDMKKRKQKEAIDEALGTCPSCDHINIALRSLLADPERNAIAIEELCYAIAKADGYFVEDVKEQICDLVDMGFLRDFMGWRIRRVKKEGKHES